MRKTKRILAVVLTVALLFGTVPLEVASASNSFTSYAVEGGNLYFDPETGAVVDCDTSVTSAVIPAQIDGVAVTALGQLAFYDCDQLTSISVASETLAVKAGAFRDCYALSEVEFSGVVTEIGNYAFDSCDELSSLSIRGNDLVIGKYAFQYCYALTEVKLDGTVKQFGEGAFYCCSKLASMEIPEGVTALGSYAFGVCSKLTEIHLPASLKTMGTDVFGACSRLQRFTVAEGNTSFYVDEFGVLYNAEKTVLIEYPVASPLTSYTVLDGVTTIPDSAFDTAEMLEHVTLPEGLTSIGQYAFCQCYTLKSISLPSTLKRIGGDAFTSCSSLQEITLPEGLTEIGEQAFSGCVGLYSVTVPGSVKTISKGAFISCSGLYRLELSEGVETIAPNAFRNCESLVDVTIPSSLKTIGSSAFRNCDRLLSLSFPEGLVSIGQDAFCFCYDLTFVDLPESLTTIGAYAFQTCTSLQAVRVPDGVETIGRSAFAGCTNVTVYGEAGSPMEAYAAASDLNFSVGGISTISGRVVTPAGEGVVGVVIKLINTEDESYFCADVSDGKGYWCVPVAEIGETYEVTYFHAEYPDNGVEYVYTIGEEPVTADAICVIKTGFMRSGSTQIEKLSQTKLNYVMHRTYPEDSLYATQPSLSQPYSSGTLSEEHLDLALERLNDMRLIAGLPSVTLNDTYNAYCQDGALISALIGDISHYPERPYGVDSELYQRGYTACSSSNLALHHMSAADYGPLGYSVDMYMEDSDPTNIKVLGHRRWALNPTMGQTGFGCVNRGIYQFCTMYAKNQTGAAVDYDFIAWPSSGHFPLELCYTNTAWSVTLNPEKYSIPDMSDLTITMTNMETGEEFVLSGDKEYPITPETANSAYMNMSTDGCGVPNCIIFRPDYGFVWQGVYTVRIDGLLSRWGRETSLYYYVNLTGINDGEKSTQYGFCNYGLEWTRDEHDLFWLSGPSELPCELYLAAYAPSGKMIDMECDSVKLFENVHMILDCPDGTLVKLFRTDENGQPASVAWSHQF